MVQEMAQALFIGLPMVLATPLSVYHLNDDSRSVWRDGRLDSLLAQTDENGTTKVVDLTRDAEGKLGTKGIGGWSPRRGPVFPTNHWNPAVIGAREVLNTISGDMNRVTVTHLGLDALDAGAGPIQAHHFQYEGQSRADVWYDKRGRWVKLAFDGSDGSRIEYPCDQSGGGETASRRQPGQNLTGGNR